MKKIVFLIVALMMPTSFTHAGEVRTQIDARCAELVKAWNNKDHKGVVAIMDKEFYVFSETVELSSDRDAFEKLVKSEVADYTNLKLETTSLKVHGNEAFQFGTGSYSYKDETGKDVRGKSDLLNIWKKDDKGVWYIHLEMWWGSDSDEVKDVKVFADIDARTAELTTAWNREDYEAVIAMFDEGFLLISGVGKPTGDRDAHRKQLALEVKEYPSVHYKTNTLKVNGKLAYAIGVETFTFTGEDGKDTTGKDDFLIVWKKDDKGIWNIHLEFWWDIGSDE